MFQCSAAALVYSVLPDEVGGFCKARGSFEGTDPAVVASGIYIVDQPVQTVEVAEELAVFVGVSLLDKHEVLHGGL